jgi:hypothetical protein
MRTLLSFGVAALAVGMASPVSAEMMCSPAGQQGAATTGGMMCGGGTTGQAQAPNATPANPQAQGMGGCPCCRNMAMMGGGQQGGGMNMPGHSMPGMEMPKPQ